jgi:hypothetical protein
MKMFPEAIRPSEWLPSAVNTTFAPMVIVEKLNSIVE